MDDDAREAPSGDGSGAAPDEPASGSEKVRYRIVERDGQRLVICGNSPNIALRIERGLSVDKGTRKRYPRQSIFLDGAYTGAPFLDNEARHYSLDHHEGCVRAFMLATCEQAMVMLLQGLPLNEGDWTVYVNDPDLDALLAAWVLLNHVELLSEGHGTLEAAMPLIRLEGVIDAHGTKMEALAALPSDTHHATKAKIEGLLSRERQLKREGAWEQADWEAYARDTLVAVDRLVFPDGYLHELLELREGGRVPIHGARIAVLIRSTQGIYAVENRLKERHGAALGVIVLEQGAGRFTLRQVDPFLERDLSAVYRELNRKDPNARRGRSPNLWGGADDIGGSPRATGSGLSGPEVLAVVKAVLGPRESWMRRLLRWLLGPRERPPALPPAS